MTKKIIQISPFPFEHLGWVEKYAEILEEIFAKNAEDKTILSEIFKNWIWKNQENSQKQEVRGGEKILKGTDYKVNDWKMFDDNDEIRSFSEFSTLCGWKDFEIIEPVKNCPLPKFWSPNFWKFVKKIRKNPPKIIISHIRFAPTAWMAFWLCKSINARYIHIEHGTGFLVHNNFFIRNIAKIIDVTIGKYILKNSDFVITISKAGENWVKNFTGRTKNIETIYRGFEIMKNEEWKMKNFWKNFENQKIQGGENFAKIFKTNKKNICNHKNSEKCREKSLLNPLSQGDLQENFFNNFRDNHHKKPPSPCGRGVGGEVTLGFVGRLVPLKNLGMFIEILKNFEKKIDWKFYIIGDGEIRYVWENLAKNLWLSEKIHFFGAKNHHWILKNFLPNIDIFVNPSLQEWLPTAIVEAKISGCEVLATDVGGTNEIPDIWLCKPTETDLQENLEKILTNFLSTTSKKSVWQKISNEFLEKFSLETMKENYLKIFEKL